jgi:2-methylcitrate dehydratase PrpD
LADRPALDRIAARLAEERPVTPLAADRARRAVIDTLGCIFAGASDAATRAVARAVSAENGEAPVSVLGLGLPAGQDALLIGTAAHALDFDDNFHPARAHASAVLVPALMAVAARMPRCTGPAFLQAYLDGLEAMALVGHGVNPSHYNRGWHATATVGCIGAAAGAARLLGSDTAMVAQAMSLAASQAAGLKGQFGAPLKPVHAGMAARNAVAAAYLARAGLTGRLDILERPQGFLDLFGGEESRGWDDLPDPGAHVIETRGLVTKRHPCCASTHRAVDALLDLKRELRIRADDVASIHVRVGRSAALNLPYDAPGDEMQARFSMPYCLARAFEGDGLRLADFAPGRVEGRADPRLMALVRMESYTAAEEAGVERLPHVLNVTLRDGSVHGRSRLHAVGAIEDPMPPEALRAKFDDCRRHAGNGPWPDFATLAADLESDHAMGWRWGGPGGGNLPCGHDDRVDRTPDTACLPDQT